MDYEIVPHKHGFRTLFIPMTSTDSVTLLLLTKAGSRYETDEISGLSHFIEHMFFKGGKKYTSTKEVSEAIDNIGGEFNAYTSKEYAGYYIKVAKEYIDIAFDVLSDMVMHATFPKKDFMREKQIILEEIKMYEDNPMYKASMSFEQLMFRGHELERDIAGTKETVTDLTREQLLAYKKKMYIPQNIIFAIAGNYDRKTAEKKIELYFPLSSTEKDAFYAPFTAFSRVRTLNIQKQIEQTNVVIGTSAISYTHPDRHALQLLSTMLGGNMSSRMFMEVREKLGLCYYIHTGLDLLADTGYIATYAGVDSGRTTEAINAIIHEYERISKDLDKNEVDRAIHFLRGKTTLLLEDNEEKAFFYGRQLLLEDRIEDLDEIVSIMKKYTVDELKHIAKKYLKDFRIVTVGPAQQSAGSR